jgi:hypothetical protein
LRGPSFVKAALPAAASRAAACNGRKIRMILSDEMKRAADGPPA